MSKLVIIFDPVCGTARGHNYRTMIKYAEWIKGRLGMDSELWIPFSDCDPSETTFTVTKKLPWVYEYFMPVGRRNIFSFLQRGLFYLKRKFQNKIIRFFLAIYALLIHYYAVRKVESSLRAALKKKPAYVFLPGADLYSLLALSNLVCRGLVPESQVIILRLMGVMETAGYFPRSKQAMLLALKNIIRHHKSIKISAETEKYASYLSRNLKVSVPVTHIPTGAISEELLTNSKQNNIVELVCLGGARADKGYFELVDLAKFVRKMYGKKVVFVVQTMSKSNIDYNADYELSLAKTLNIRLLPSFLTDAEMFENIGAADAIFLPYSVGTYEYRGSAILFDSLGYGKPLLGRGGTGFGTTIDMAGLGSTFRNFDELATGVAKIVALTDSSKLMLLERQEKYLAKMVSDLEGLFDEKDIVRFY